MADNEDSTPVPKERPKLDSLHVEEMKKGNIDGSDESISTTVNNESLALLKKDDDDERAKSLLIGIGLAFLFSISTTLSIPCLQLLGPKTAKPMELMFFGFLGHLITSIPVWFFCWGRLQKLEWHQAKWLTVAGIANGLSTSCFYMSAESLPSGVVGALGQGSLLFVSILAVAVLDKKIGVTLVVASVVCVIGLILYLTSVLYYDPVTVIPPPYINTSTDPLLLGSKSHSTRNVITEFHPSMSYIVLIISSFLLILANVIIHKKFTKVSISKLLLFFPVIGFITVTILMFSITTPHWGLDLSKPQYLWPFLGFIVLFDISNVSLYACWMRTPAPIFSLIAATSIAFLVIVQYTVNVPDIESGHPDALEILGALLILAANVIGTVGELKIKD